MRLFLNSGRGISAAAALPVIMVLQPAAAEPFFSCNAPFTPIYRIQGSGAAAAITGPVTTQGVVIADYEGPAPNLRGFYLQDPNGDGDATTSDGIFVFNDDNNSVKPGDLVRVTGQAKEFYEQTEIAVTAGGSVTVCGPGPVIAPTDVTLPFPEPAGGVPFLERFEGMLVRLPQTLYVTELSQLGRFGQFTASSGDRLYQPTGIAKPGSIEARMLQTANALNRIIIDDRENNQHPDPIIFPPPGLSADNTLRIGYTVTGVVGVMTYTWGGNSASPNAYRVRPTETPNFAATNPRPVTPPPVGGSLKVAGANVQNYFTTLNQGGATCGPQNAPCRGANSEAELNRQRAKIVNVLRRLDAAVVGLMELENNGFGPNSAIGNLVNSLNAVMGADTYAIAARPDAALIGDHVIKVGLIYKPALVRIAPGTTVEILDDSDDPTFNSTFNRPALAATFAECASGERFTVVVNHFKSKGGLPCAEDSQPGYDDQGQGNCNVTRTNAAKALVNWLKTDPTHSGDDDILIIGDLNAYAMEDPITALEAGGYRNLIKQFGGPKAYSLVFDGQSGYLDYALANPSLTAQVTGAAEWHINADEPSVLDYHEKFKSQRQIASLYTPEPYRAADHDPVVVGLRLAGIKWRQSVSLQSPGR